MAWQMQPQQMQSMQQPMQQMQAPQMQQHQQHQMHQQYPQQQMQQQVQPPQMQHQSQASKGGCTGKGGGKGGGKGMMQQQQPRPPATFQNQNQPPAAFQNQNQPPAAFQNQPPAAFQNQGRPQSIEVSGCNNATVSNIIKGSFSVSGSNHGKPVYKKDNTPSNVTVLIYYWDDRDGPTFSGWWIGPKLGGDEVWSHAENRQSPTPPPAGWHVPWDGPLDPTLKLTYSAGRGANSTPPTPAPCACGAQSNRPVMGKGHVVGARPPGTVKPPLSDVQANRQELERKKHDGGAAPNHRLEEFRRKSAEAEEAQRKRQEDTKRQREEDNQRRKEQTASTAVRKVLAKVRAARPDNYDALRIELEDSIATNLEAMGSMASKVGQEAEEVLQAAQARIDEIANKRAQDERARIDEEKRRRHDAENSAQFVEQAKADAEKLLSKLQEVQDQSAALEEETDPSKLLERTEAVEKKLQSTRDEVNIFKASVYDKQKSLGDSMLAGKIRRELQEVQGKLSTGLRSLEQMLRSMQSRREKVAGKAAAMEKINEKKSIFAKFDLDRDGKLNKKEVEAYMKATINFDLPQAVLEQIVTKLDPITFVKFRSLHQRLFIAKSELLAREARAKEEAERLELEEKRKSLMSVISEAASCFDEADAEVMEAERNPRSDATSADIEEGIQQLEAAMKSIEQATSNGQSKLAEARERLQGLEKTDVPSLLRRLENREKSLQSGLQHLKELSQDLREKAEKAEKAPEQ